MPPYFEITIISVSKIVFVIFYFLARNHRDGG